MNRLTKNEVDFTIPDGGIEPTKLSAYKSNSFSFIPTTPPTNPKEGQTYYDKTTHKLKIFTGSQWEIVTSV